MDIEEKPNSNDEISRTSTNHEQNTLLALVSVRPPTPEKCAVCLNNKQTDIIARIDSCSHTFCFACILEWSKVRAICPLCKQPFTTITRERYSGEVVEEIRVTQPQRTSRGSIAEVVSLNEALNWFSQPHRRSENANGTLRNDIFRQMVYIEWLSTLQAIVRRPNVSSRNSSSNLSLVRSTIPSSSRPNLISSNSIRRLLRRYARQTTAELQQSTIYSLSTRQTVVFRKYIYLNKLYVQSPLVGHDRDRLTIRECSPGWYASNPACLHRLVPFLTRELLALLWREDRTIEHIIQEILTTIQLHDIRSNFLARKLHEYLDRYTKHFIHEFYTFARCPYDLDGFDRHAQYPLLDISSLVTQPTVISLDEHDDGNEQTPIVIDENSDESEDVIDIATSSPLPATTVVSEHRLSSSSECEIVEYIEPILERPPSLIVLSEDDNNDDEADDSNDEAPTSSTTKRKHSHHHQGRKSRRQQTATTIEVNSPIDVVLDDVDGEVQSDNSTQEESQRMDDVQ